MPITESSRYVTVSTVITKDQRARLEALRRAREAELGGKVPGAEIHREALEAGLRTLEQAAGSIRETRPETSEERVA